MKSRREPSPSLQAVEPLEVRTLLAGNVLASFRNGRLSLKGDNSSNCVAVVPTQSGFEVIGCLNPGTTVNGQALAAFPGTGIRDLRANMKSGNDELFVQATIRGSLTAKLGSGSDRLVVTTEVARNVKAAMGSGSDEFRLEGLVVGNVSVNTGSGPSNVVFDESVVFDSAEIRGNTKVRGGRGDQAVVVGQTSFLGNVSVSLGGDNDVFAVIDNATSFGGQVVVNGGSGEDRFSNDGFFVFVPKNFEIFL